MSPKSVRDEAWNGFIGLQEKFQNFRRQYIVVLYECVLCSKSQSLAKMGKIEFLPVINHCWIAKRTAMGI